MKHFGTLALLCCTLFGCGPVSVQQAERECFERARLAAAPRGEIAVGVNNRGDVGGEFTLNVSSEYLQGKDPAAVYDSCVFQRSGQPPTRPLYERPDWRG